MVTPVSKRIELIISHFKLNKSSFSKAIGLTNNVTIGRIIDEQREPSYQVLVKILQTFGSINAGWLMTGEGEMLLNPEDNAENNVYTPYDKTSFDTATEPENAYSVHPTKRKNVQPTVQPTPNLGLPKVVTVTENNDDIISLVGVKVAAGYLNGYSDPEYIETLPTLRVPGVKGGTHRAFEVKGHSMSPTLYNSSIVVGRWVEDFSEIRDRRIYIVVTKSEGIVVKRVLNRISETDRLILISDNHNKKEYPNILLPPDDVLEIWYVRGAFSFEFPEPDALNQRVNDLEARLTFLNDKIDRLGL